MLDKILYVFLAIAIITGVARLFINNPTEVPVEGVACTMDAFACPDGSSVGRSGPTCEFVCPSTATTSTDTKTNSSSKTDLIEITNPVANAVISSPLIVTGQARGPWFFEGSFPVLITNSDQAITIASGYATAETDSMTEDFVPFKAKLDFDIQSYMEGGYDISKGAIIVLKKDNPSGLPEYDDEVQIPIRFAP